MMPSLTTDCSTFLTEISIYSIITTMKLIIQIPCYNEEKTLTIALDHLPKKIEGIDEIEYLIINDGSRDNTVEVAKEWGINYVVNLKLIQTV